VALLAALYAAGAGGLALQRHRALQSQALDMGYADQVAWNTLHGRPFRFTVFRGDVGAERGQSLRYGPGADRDSLFAYHAELLFLPVALFYLIHAGPETLIALLTAVLAAGVWPAYGIARRWLAHRGAAVAFGAVYLLSPAVQAANLSDFHAVSLTAALLLFAFWALLERRDAWFVLLAVACVAAKEEVGLLVGMMGLYAWLALGRARLGPATAALAFGWTALCFLVLIPHANGGAPSPFAGRYGDALRQARAAPTALLAGAPVPPVPEYTGRYVGHLLAGSGFLALLAPAELLLAAPALAINGLSDSAWQHGGGAHYSAEAVPAVLVAAIAGAARLAGWLAPRLRRPTPAVALAVALVALALAAGEARREGILPPAARFAWPAPSGRAERLQALLERIPPDAPVSAQSNLFPHLSRRERAYVFPALEDAEYVLVDVVGPSAPLYPDDLFAETAALLLGARFEVLGADDGLLLLRRRPAPGGGRAGGPADSFVPAAFLDFTRGADPVGAAPARARFDGALELVGYRLEPVLEVNYAARRAVAVLDLRAVRPLDRNYRFPLYVVGRDGGPRLYDDGNAAQLWRPTSRWRPGEVVRLRYPAIAFTPGDRLGVGAQLGSDPAAPRLPIDAGDLPALEGRRVALLGRLP
jgi:uncharacterized membrane protein